MATTIQIKRGDGAPGSLLEGEIAFDKAGKRLFIGGEGGSATGGLFAMSGMSTSSLWGHFQQPVLNIQVDATLAASQTDGSRYLITNAAALHANFGTISSPVAVANGDIVEYEIGDAAFKVVFDQSAAGIGGSVFNIADGTFYENASGTTWSSIDANVTLDDAYENGGTITLSADTGVAINNADQTGVGAMLSLTQSATGASTSLLDLNNSGSDDTIAIDMSGLNTGDTAIAFGTGQAPTSAAAGNFWYASNDLSYHDGTAIRTVANLEESQTFSGDTTLSAGLNLTSVTQDVYSIVTPTGGFSAANSLINKEYVDSVAAGLDPKESVNSATTAVLSGTMTADDVAPTTGNRSYDTTALTITWFATQGPTTLDGVTLANGDRILVKDESATSGPSAGEGRTYNGIYVRTSADVWTRADDHDGTPANEVSGGNYTFVEQGTVNENAGFVLQGDGELTLDTDNIVFVQFSGSGAFTASNGVLKSGADFQLDIANVTNTGTTIAAGDFLAYSDTDDGTSAGRTENITLANFVESIDGSGLVANSGVLDLNVADIATTGTVVATGDLMAYDDGGTTSKITVDLFLSQVTDATNSGLSSTAADLVLDLSDLAVTAAVVADDSIAFIDATDSTSKKTTMAALFALAAGDGLDSTSGVLSVDLKANGGLVIESTEIAVDLSASSITGTLAVGDGGTGLTAVTQASVLVSNNGTKVIALDGTSPTTDATAIGFLAVNGSDAIVWTSVIDGGTF